ncbi:serine hydrolase [Litoribacter ruber]|uniref:serine hydrolase n=1 Tax=Litoribacter ruber TaxID=702568 RepID=UPI001BD96A2A|nr:serine hydrolase [Litoribacter ruber]MBT0810439.1 serine hydrolase [Litoribacter ruber]
MRYLLTLLIFGCLTANLFAQSENHTENAERFKSNFNDEDYDQIFEVFSAQMKSALPVENTRKFLNDLRNQFGDIQDMEFIKFEQSISAVYKTTFDKEVLLVNIALNDQNEISGLLVRPYEEEAELAERENGLTDYPEKFASSIFSKVNQFPENTELAIAVISEGVSSYYGTFVGEEAVRPIENHHKVFEIGSITKVFTAAVLATLVNEGQLDLEGEVNTWFPFDFHKNSRITYLQLANHTSGLPRMPSNFEGMDPENPFKYYGEEKLEDYLKQQLEISKPGDYEYSNLGVGLLGYSMAMSQGKSYEQLVDELVFVKYDMGNTYMRVEDIRRERVQGMNPKGEVVSNWDFDVLSGAGGVLSTLEDLVKFAKANFNEDDKVLALLRESTHSINNTMDMGLGWHILKSQNGNNAYWHNGGTGGYSSSMVIDPVKKTAVIILSNVSGLSSKKENIDKLCFELFSLN